MKFLSTLSLRRATPKRPKHQTQTQHFYPRSPCGERRETTSIKPIFSDFYPRSPCGERQDTVSTPDRPEAFLSTLSLRRATRFGTIHNTEIDISIHALLAESDKLYSRTFHTLRNFYPRSPCGERHIVAVCNRLCFCISIHALLAESDLPPPARCTARTQFLSTLSLRRATKASHLLGVPKCISIHALLAESDSTRSQPSKPRDLFLSTLSLRRATTPPYNLMIHHAKFLSTLSLRRATTPPYNLMIHHAKFLSTLSLRRATGRKKPPAGGKGFLSTLSLRRATKPKHLKSRLCVISIHALLAESDL